MAITKPTHGATGWDTAVNDVIDYVNDAEDLPDRVDALEATRLTVTGGDSRYLRLVDAGIPFGVGDGVADDTAALNTALAAGGVVRGKAGLEYRITGPLVIKSDTVLDMTGCRVTLDVPTQSNLLNNRAVDTVQRTITDAVMSEGDVTLTSVAANFTSNDVGRTIVVVGAGPVDGPVTARIVSVTNESTVELDTPADLDITAVPARIYDRDSNILVVGGIWNAGHNQDGPDTNGRHMLRFRHVDGLTVRDLRVISTGGKYAVNAGDVTGFTATGISLDTASDGVHIQGPASEVLISDITGSTGDDSVALGSYDFAQYNDVQGVISGFVVQNVSTTTNQNIIKLFSLERVPINNGTVRNISGHCLNDNTAVTFDTDVDSEPGWINNVLVDGVRTRSNLNYFVAVQLSSNSTNIQLRDIVTDYGYAAQVVEGFQIDNLAISGIAHTGTDPGYHMIPVRGTVGRMSVTNFDTTLPDSASVLFLSSTADIGTLRIADGRASAPFSGCVIDAQNNGATCGRAVITGVEATNLAWLVASDIELTAHLSDTVVDGLNSFCYVASNGTVTILNGAGLAGDDSGVVRETSGHITVQAPDYPIDIQQVNDHTVGDRARNTNDGLDCGIGPVMWTGTSWQNLATGDTYTP